MNHFSQRKTQLFTRVCKAVHGLAHLQTTPHCRPHLPSLTEPQPWRSCKFFSRQHTVPPVDLALAVPSAWSVFPRSQHVLSLPYCMSAQTSCFRNALRFLLQTWSQSFMQAAQVPLSRRWYFEITVWSKEFHF